MIVCRRGSEGGFVGEGVIFLKEAYFKFGLMWVCGVGSCVNSGCITVFEG